MKNKILFLTIAAIGALLITATNGFSYGSYGDNVNTACAPASPYTGGDCAYCHTGSKGDPTDAKDAYLAGGTTLTDYFCPTQPACNDSDGDGYGNPGDSSCRFSAEDCDDTDASINPGAVEDCNDGIDNDCDGTIDSEDIDCYTCDQHTDRGQCKADPRCSWSGKNKECTEPVVSDAQSNCEADGGRWNKKKGTCR